METDNSPSDSYGARGFAGLQSLVSNIGDVTARPPESVKSTGSSRTLPPPAPPPLSRTYPSNRQDTDQGCSEQKKELLTQRRELLRTWMWWGVGIGGLFILITTLNGNQPTLPATDIQSVSSSTGISSPTHTVLTPPAWSDLTPPPSEEIPPAGLNNLLSRTQITYCLAQNIRLDAAQGMVRQSTAADVDRYNAMIADYNSRCGQYQYEQGSRETARKAVESFRPMYHAEGLAWFAPQAGGASSAPALKPVGVNQGIHHIYTKAKRIAPFRITTGTGQDNYFIKLVDANTKSPVMTIYVHGGRTFETKVPLGTYGLRYATGRTWYGTKLLFGPQTGYSEVDENLTFSIEGNEVQGNIIELVPRIGGNLKTKSISANEF